MTATAPTVAALRVGAILIDIEGDRARDIATVLAEGAITETRAGDREAALMLLEDATTIADMAYPEGTPEARALENVLVAAAGEYERRWPPTGVTP